MPLFYVDTSAFVKLVRDEPESDALRAYLADADLIVCELALAELARAIRRAAALDLKLEPEPLLARAGALLESVALVPLDRELLLAAGALAEPTLRTLDAIHVAAAVATLPHAGFVGYDERRAAAARLAGLRTFAPGG